MLVRTLFREYADSIGIDLSFQGFEEELAGLPGKYALSGWLFIAFEAGVPVGCVALRPLSPLKLRTQEIVRSARGPRDGGWLGIDGTGN